MNPTKLELYENHQVGGNALPTLSRQDSHAFSRALSDSPSNSVSDSEDERDGSKKRKRPMNVT